MVKEQNVDVKNFSNIVMIKLIKRGEEKGEEVRKVVQVCGFFYFLQLQVKICNLRLIN